MKKLINPKIFFFFIVILIGCEYQNSDINFVDINQNVDPPKLTSSLDFYSDTIFFRQSYSAQWEFKCDKKILLIQFLLDGNLYQEFHTLSNGYLDFDNSFFPNLNFRKLTCLVYVKSGTGSLADKLDAEALFLKKEWVAVFVPSSFQPSVINKIYRDSLDIVVEYNRYEGPDFKSYYLVKNYSDTIAATTDQNLLQLRDITYSGEKAEYELITSLKSEAALNKSDRNIYSDYPQYSITYLGNNKYRVDIPKMKYISRLKSIRFYEQTSYYSDYQLIKETPISDNMSFTLDNMKMMPELNYLMMFLPKSIPAEEMLPIELPDYSINLRSLATPFVDYNFIGRGSNSNVYLSDFNGNILCYNTAQKKITDTLAKRPGYAGYFGISVTGKTLIVSTGDNTFDIRKTADNSLLYKLNSTDLNPKVQRTQIAISDNGIFAYFDYSNIIIYDLINKKLIQNIYPGKYLNYLYISSDGSLLAMDNDVYLLNNGKYELVKSVDGTFVCSNPRNADQAYYRTSNLLILYDFKSQTEISSFPISQYFCNIDWDSHSFVYISDNKLIFKSIITGEILNQLDIRANSWYFNYVFYNKTLFFNDNSKFILNFE